MNNINMNNGLGLYWISIFRISKAEITELYDNHRGMMDPEFEEISNFNIMVHADYRK